MIRGATVVGSASDAASAFGLRSDWWVVDEIAAWDDVPSSVRFYEAISTAWPRAIVAGDGDLDCGEAGWVRGDAVQFAVAEPAWRVSEVHESPPWVDPEEIEAERRAFRLRRSCGTGATSGHRARTSSLSRRTSRRARCCPARPTTRRGSSTRSADLALRNDRAVVLTGHREGYRPDWSWRWIGSTCSRRARAGTLTFSRSRS